MGILVTLMALLAGCSAGSPSSASSPTSSGSSSSTGPVNSDGTPSTMAGAPQGSGAAGSLQSAYINVVNKLRPSVVEIDTGKALGSGIIFDNKGDIVTNDHVVSGAHSFTVTRFDGKTSSASLVGEYPPDDLAMIKVKDTTNLTPATFADSSKLQVGDITVAIGNPLGLQSSVTTGIVSAVGRTVSEGNGVTLPQTVQTSAAINPGNSGGALADLDGAVIGIPTLAAIEPTQQNLGGGAAPGIGFAIPSNTVKMIGDQLASQGKVTQSGRGALGIVAGSGYDQLGRQVGVVIEKVQGGGGADMAGLKSGELITSINNMAIHTLADLGDALATLKPGDKAQVKVLNQDGSRKTVTVTLGQLPGGG